MNTPKTTEQQIVEKFVYLDLPDKGYNNQDFYQMSDETLRYVLVTCELPYLYNGKKLKEGQEENKFYNCIEFNTYTESSTTEKFDFSSSISISINVASSLFGSNNNAVSIFFFVFF